MALLDEIGTRLATACSLTRGTTLFEGLVPDSRLATILCVLDGPSPRGPENIFGDGVVSGYHAFDVLVRADTYATGRALVDLAHESLKEVGNLVIAGASGSARYLTIDATGEPYKFDEDDNGRHFFRCSYTAEREQ